MVGLQRDEPLPEVHHLQKVLAEDHLVHLAEFLEVRADALLGDVRGQSGLDDDGVIVEGDGRVVDLLLDLLLLHVVIAGDEEKREHHERVEHDDAEGGVLVGVGDSLALALGILGPNHDGGEGDAAERSEALVAGVGLLVRDPHLVERPEREDREYEEHQEVVPQQLEPEHDSLAEFSLHFLLLHPERELLRGLLRVICLLVRLQPAHARQRFLQVRGFVQVLLHLALARSGERALRPLFTGLPGAQPTAGARAPVPGGLGGLGVDILDVYREATARGGLRR